jgi:CheY-like chemotaxis protein
MLLDEGLSAHGMRVDCAANSAEALEFISKRNYDVALCDKNLSPGGKGTSGRETAQLIATSSRGGGKPEVVFMTGDLVEENGSGNHIRELQKPFRISDVLAILREVLAARSAEKLS